MNTEPLGDIVVFRALLKGRFVKIIKLVIFVLKKGELILNSNYNNLKKELKELISSSKSYKHTNKYKNEINIFLKYLEDNNLEDKILVLKDIDIVNYFAYCQNNYKLGSKSTLDTHISALKCILEYMIEKNYPYAELLGYISNREFRRAISSNLREIKSKEVISIDELRNVLNTLDKYIVDKKINSMFDEIFWKTSFVQVYIKINLLVPLKINQMLEITFDMFENDFRAINYKDYIIKIPNSLRLNIISILKSIDSKYSVNDYFFSYISKPLNSMIDSSTLSRWFYTAFNEVGLKNFLPEKNIYAKKKSYTYPVEKFKKTAIWMLLNKGFNILYLSEITELSVEILAGDYLFDFDKNEASKIINEKLVCNNYYEYL